VADERHAIVGGAADRTPAFSIERLDAMIVEAGSSRARMELSVQVGAVGGDAGFFSGISSGVSPSGGGAGERERRR
jgi:hypothetical protein